MSVGCIGYAHSRGLGHLVRDFYRHRIIDDVMVVRHPSIPVNEDWYPGAGYTTLGRLNPIAMVNFCRRHEAVLFFETPFHWPLMDACRDAGVRAYLVTMYECFPQSGFRHLPHKFLCPSLLDVDYFKDYPHELVQLPVEYPWRQRTRAMHYVHNGGYLGIRHREGTLTLIDAMRHVRSPLRLTVRVQENVPKDYQAAMARDPRVEYVNRQVPYEELYAEGDVTVGAQKWNGCSLPLQEAFAAGTFVINTDRYPMNTWLPTEGLVTPARYWPGSSIGGPYLKFDEAFVEPKDLARMMDFWYGADVTEQSNMGRAWAERNSWAVLGPVWKELLKH